MSTQSTELLVELETRLARLGRHKLLEALEPGTSPQDTRDLLVSHGLPVREELVTL